MNEYYYSDGSKSVFGPYSLEELAALASDGLINAKTQVILKGIDKWYPYSSYVALATAIRHRKPGQPLPRLPKKEKPIATTICEFFAFFQILGLFKAADSLVAGYTADAIFFAVLSIVGAISFLFLGSYYQKKA